MQKYTQPLYWEPSKPMTGEDIAEACEMAADLLEGHWTTGEWFQIYPDRKDENDEDIVYMCVEGALMAALFGVDENDVNSGGEPMRRDRLTMCPVFEAVLAVANEQVLAEDKEPFSGLANWNDESGVDEQRVLDVLHLTAKRALGVEG